MDQNLKTRLEKIQRLMESAGSVGEAEAAAAAFQRLVMKHNVDSYELGKLGHNPDDDYVFVSINLKAERATGVKFRLRLLHVLATANFCTSIIEGRQRDGWMTLVGKQSNVDAVRSMYLIMSVTFQRLAADGWKAYRKVDPLVASALGGGQWRRSFLAGVPNGLYDKFRAERAQESTEDPNVNAVVLVSDQELKLAINNRYQDGLRTEKARSTRVVATAYGEGYKAGREYSDAKPIRAGALSLSDGS